MATKSEVSAPVPVGDDSSTENNQEVQTVPVAQDDSNLPLSTPFKTALYVTIIDFFKPLFVQLKDSHDSLKTTVEYFEGVWAKLEAFINKFDSIWGITWDDIYELTVSARDEVVSFFRNGNASLQIVFRLWYQSHLTLRESLEEIERLHEYVVPPVKGEKPLYPKEARKKSGIRWQCYYMNMNLVNRLFLRSSSFLSHILVYFFEKPSIVTGTVTIEEVKEALESFEKAAESADGVIVN